MDKREIMSHIDELQARRARLSSDVALTEKELLTYYNMLLKLLAVEDADGAD